MQEYNLEKNSNTVLRRIIRKELETPSECLGYRGMWHLLRKLYSIHVARDSVVQIVEEADPEGTAQGRT